MILESFAHDLNKVITSTMAEAYHVHWVSGEHTESGKPMKVSRKLGFHWSKRECLERAQALQKQALEYHPGKYPFDANNLGKSIEDCLKRIRIILEQGFYDAEFDEIKPLINKAFWI